MDMDLFELRSDCDIQTCIYHGVTFDAYKEDMCPQCDYELAEAEARWEDEQERLVDRAMEERYERMAEDAFADSLF